MSIRQEAKRAENEKPAKDGAKGAEKERKEKERKEKERMEKESMDKDTLEKEPTEKQQAERAEKEKQAKEGPKGAGAAVHSDVSITCPVYAIHMCKSDRGLYCCGNSNCNLRRSCPDKPGLLGCACPLGATRKLEETAWAKNESYRKEYNPACPAAYSRFKKNPRLGTDIKESKSNPLPSLHFMTIQRHGKTSERYQAQKDSLAKNGIEEPEVVEAVMGDEMDKDPWVIQYFKKHGITGGGFGKHFPHLHPTSHGGTKGIWMANIKALEAMRFKPQDKKTDWMVLFESDGTLPDNGYGPYADRLFFQRLALNAQPDTGMIWLDDRAKLSHCCTSGVMYRVNMIPQLLKAFDPLGEEAKRDRREPNSHDMYLHALCEWNVVGCEHCGFVKSGQFGTEVSDPSNGNRIISKTSQPSHS